MPLLDFILPAYVDKYAKSMSCEIVSDMQIRVFWIYLQKLSLNSSEGIRSLFRNTKRF